MGRGRWHLSPPAGVGRTQDSRVGKRIKGSRRAKKKKGKKNNAQDHTYATTPLRCDVVIIKRSRAAAAAAAQMDRMKEAGAATQSLITMQRSRRANRRRSGSLGGPSPSSFIPAAAEEAEFHFSNDNSLGLALCISSFSSHSSSSFFLSQSRSPLLRVTLAISIRFGTQLASRTGLILMSVTRKKSSHVEK